jgi:hypothetical protein
MSTALLEKLKITAAQEVCNITERKMHGSLKTVLKNFTQNLIM